MLYQMIVTALISPTDVNWQNKFHFPTKKWTVGKKF